MVTPIHVGLLEKEHVEPFVSAPQAAEFLGITVAALYEATKRGTFPAYRLGRRRLRFRLSELAQVGRSVNDGALTVDAPTTLKPLAAIADAYEANDLDEARPERNQGLERDLKTVLVSGRGGKTLLTLADAFKAREVLRTL